MPRKPNYKFERFERDRAKAVKKAARLEAKAARRNEKKGDEDDDQNSENTAAALSDSSVETSSDAEER